MANYKIYFDGNKTPQGTTCSYLLVDNNEKKLKEITKYLPDKTTVPEAEYHGLIFALEDVISELKNSNNQELKNISLEIFGDSQLVIRQINGDYECKKPELRILRSKIRTLLEQFSSWELTWVPRDQNLVR